MNPSNTICVGQEGPANALALNKDCTQVVIAGRNVFKVFSCADDEFSEVCNLRVGKNLNLNFSSIDVAWSAIEENTLATAATNGAVVVWNLGRSGRSKQEHVFSDHKRTVNKVSFHLTEPAILISGSQDGMMKCFDLRMKEVTRTFISNCESVRDVQFSPSCGSQFAAVSENGSAQVWDVRRHERPLHHFTAHSGPVFACDWHPDQPWLATASRDKTIKVWDMQGKPTLEHTIYTIASVGHVKWRPNKKYQISSCALVLDCAVHVWHVRRPCVPLATFAEHRDVTTALAWQREDAFLSTSRDCTLYRHYWSSAAHPVLWAPPQAVGVSSRGELAQAVPRAPLPAPLPPKEPASSPPAPVLGRKQPTAGSLSVEAQASLERLFPGGGGAALTRWRAPPPPLPKAALGYRLRGGSVGSLAQHNAATARAMQRHLVAHVWDVVACLYKSSEATPRAVPPPPPPRAPPPRPPAAPSEYSAVEEEPPEEVSEWTEFHNSGVLGLPTHSIYIPPAKFAKLGDDESPGWVSAASAHYVDVDAADWTLPEEAFPAGQPRAPLALATHAAHATQPTLPHDDSQETAGSSTSSASPGGSSGDSPSVFTTRPDLSQNDSSSGGGAGGGEEGCEGAGLALRAAPPRPPPAPAPLLAHALKLHAELGDVQTAVSVLIVLNTHRSDLLPYIEESLQEQWLLAYVELLQRHKLFNVAIEVIGLAWVGAVWGISQQSTTVAVACARCGRRGRAARAPPACDACRQRDVCAVCKQVVRGLYAWCQGCAHGGHLHHMQRWMQQRRLCPAGCGHRCQLP